MTRDSKILGTLAFIFILSSMLLRSRGSSAANKTASTCLSDSFIPDGNFKILESLLLFIFFLLSIVYQNFSFA